LLQFPTLVEYCVACCTCRKS